MSERPNSCSRTQISLLVSLHTLEQVSGFPAARTCAERGDSVLSAVLGRAHDEAAGVKACGCQLCAFNRGGDGAPWLMIADAKECGEGVSFFGVRRLLIAGVSAFGFLECDAMVDAGL